MKPWEIIADNLHDAGWSLGWVATADVKGRTIWIVDAQGYGKRFIVRSDDKLSAFLELERAVCIHLLNVTAESAGSRNILAKLGLKLVKQLQHRVGKCLSEGVVNAMDPNY